MSSAIFAQQYPDPLAQATSGSGRAISPAQNTATVAEMSDSPLSGSGYYSQATPPLLSSTAGYRIQEPNADAANLQVPMSQPTPPQIGPETPPAGNVQNFYGGNTPVQDLASILPGRFENTKYKWYGFVRLDAIFDFNPIGSTDDFVTSTIPIPQGRGQNAVLTPRYTRIGFDTETPWKEMDWTIRTRIELDFFNGNTSGAFGSFPPRLRFAWVDFGPFLIGQAASLFMDYDVFPNVLDYEGPPGMILVRQPIAAFRVPVNEKTAVAVGIEQPYSDIQWFDGTEWVVNPGTGFDTTAGVPRNVEDVPDLTGNIRRNGKYGHTQLAGIARFLTYQPGVGDDLNKFGYGLNVTGTWHLWSQLQGCPMGEEKSPLERTRILYQYAAGDGINRYFQDVNGLGLDGTFDPINGFRLIPSTGWFVAYEHWWAKNWISTFTYGETTSNLTPTLPANTYQRATYGSANLIWIPHDRMGVGIEYLYGTRENFDEQSGIAHRIQSSFQYKF